MKVFITTFEKGWNQGKVLPVAVLELQTQTRKMPIIHRGGCFSGEIIPDQEIETVIINDGIAFHEYISDKGWGSEFEKSGAEIAISVPWEIAERIRKTFQVCPHCHQTIN